MRHRRIIGILFCACSAVLFSMAVGTVFSQRKAEEIAGARIDALLPLVEQQVYTFSLSTSQPTVPASASERAMPVAEVEGESYIGTLHFPTLRLTLPVHAACSETLLETAPCRQYGTVDGDDLVIAGHNYRRHFKRLRTLSVGDPICFTDMHAIQYTYVVSGFETMGPNELDRMLSGDWSMSLYTCTSGGEKRFTVRCVRTEE